MGGCVGSRCRAAAGGGVAAERRSQGRGRWEGEWGGALSPEGVGDWGDPADPRRHRPHRDRWAVGCVDGGRLGRQGGGSGRAAASAEGAGREVVEGGGKGGWYVV